MAAKKRVVFWVSITVFLLLFSIASYSTEKAEIKGFVNDYAGVISPDYESRIDSLLKELYDNEVAEFAVVTVDNLGGQDIEGYALNLAQGKLGDNEKNNGLLLLVAVEDRKYRFEVGRGLEPVLNDAKVGRIGREYLADNFRQGEYGKGIYEACVAVKGSLTGQEYTENSGRESEPKARKTDAIIIVLILFFVLFIVIASISSFKRKTYRRRNRYFDAAVMTGALFGRGGGGFSGGFGGGFGGFGGGSFGGGGAGSGW